MSLTSTSAEAAANPSGTMPSSPSIAPADTASIFRAANMLREGKLVAFPTETVYGLGGDATNDHAVASIYAAKDRPQINPLIIHVADAAALDALIIWNEIARLLAAQFWPGPLTLILPRAKHCPVSLLASAGLETLAVRVPSHPVARQLIRETGRPIAAPSANASGKLSPTTPLHVADSLGAKVDLIIASGKSAIGLESTVLDLTTAVPTILRPGAVTLEQLHLVLGEVARGALDAGVKSPGQLLSHYAPDLPLRLNAANAKPGEAYLAFGPNLKPQKDQQVLNLSESGDLNEAAANLFSMLRMLDKPDFQGIAVAPIPVQGLGEAINDRLRRAEHR